MSVAVEEETKAENTIESGDFRFEIQPEAACRVVIQVHMQPAAAKKLYKKAIKRINKEVSIPGFRKGRAPDSTILSKFGNYVEKEWKELLMNESLRACLEHTPYIPMKKESLQRPNIYESDPDNETSVRIAYEHFPIINEIDYSKLSMPKIEKATVEDEKVSEIIEDIRRSHAEYDEVTDRAVQEGDFAEVSIHNIDEDPPKPIVEERRLEVNQEKMAKWVYDLLVGLETGKEIEGKSELDERSDENVRERFESNTCRIKLHRIETSRLPEVDDELAKKVGADSTEDMKAKILSNLEAEAEGEQKQAILKAIEEELVEQNPIELPASIKEQERRTRIKERLEELKKNGMSDEEIKAKETSIEEEVAKESEFALRRHFLLRHIEEAEGIRLTNEELNQAVTGYFQQHPWLFTQKMSKEQSNEMVSRIAAQAREQKTRERILEKVQGSTENA